MENEGIRRPKNLEMPSFSMYKGKFYGKYEKCVIQ